MDNKRKLGLVLAGGGGKGAYFIGVWKAFIEFGIDRNFIGVSGTSVGALNAMLFAQGDYQLAEAVWRNISADKILQFNSSKALFRLLEYDCTNFKSITETVLRIKQHNGIFSRVGLLDILDNHIDLYDVSNSRINLFAAAFNTNKMEIEYFSLNNQTDEMIKKILLATSALPIIFDPIEINEMFYVDGGICDNVPIRPLYDIGIRTFIVVHLDRDSLLNHYDYANSNIIEIVPSENQGGMISGTLDFTNVGAQKRINQGYMDTLEILKPIYETGLLQQKINNELNEMKSSEFIFQNELNDVLSKRTYYMPNIEERDLIESEREAFENDLKANWMRGL